MRPLRADARRNRERVLDTARALFAARGSAASFDEIARHAGVGVGTVYRHFPTRQALVEAVVGGHVAALVDRGAGLRAAADPVAAFLDFFAFVVDRAAADQALLEAVEASIRAPQPLRAALHDVLAALLARAQTAGHIRADLSAGDVHDLIVGCAATQRRARPRGTHANLLAVVCDGMRHR
ncbi:hypothetical protein BJP25_15905 [Actinokineospora bangkokensis]|uniref:HTH tetR-type domain-containing protein n=1 Tax=Actinokineospora bangkokensis TaxID=1193682 RepID=A0A1Q9LPH7_9PSEU|nr:hypothetical protein BJP25_15905 [Actinokineospora bangkokensis]